MSDNEESILSCIDKFLADTTTPFSIIEIILERAMNLDYSKVVEKIMQNGVRDTPHSVYNMLFSSFEKFKQYKIVELFLSKQNDPLYKISQYNLSFLLKHASIDGKLNVVEMLLKLIDNSLELSCTLILASANNHIDVVKLLLSDKRVNPGANDNESIKTAFKNGYLEIVKLLIPRVDMSKIDIPEIHELNKTNDDYEEAKILLKMLSRERAVAGQMCSTVGKHLYNIDRRLFSEWAEFCEYPEKKFLEKTWRKCFLPESCAIGSLRLLAFQDNPKKFMEYQNNPKTVKNDSLCDQDNPKIVKNDYLGNLIKTNKYVIDLHGECGDIWYNISIDGVSHDLYNSGNEIEIEKLKSIATSTFKPMSGDIRINNYKSFRVNDHLFVNYIYSKNDINEYELSHTCGSIGPVGQYGGLSVRFPFVLTPDNIADSLIPEIKKTLKPGGISYALGTLERKPIIAVPY
jgi:hypothetical protein